MARRGGRPQPTSAPKQNSFTPVRKPQFAKGSFGQKPGKGGAGKGGGGKGGGGKGGGGGGNWVFVPNGGGGGNRGGGGKRGGGTLRIAQFAHRVALGAKVKGGAKGGARGGRKGGPQIVDPSKAKHVAAMDRLGKIEAERKVWVGGLPEDSGRGAVERHFKESGCKPSQFEMMGKGGTACLAFKDAESASSAIDTLNGSELGGNTIEVDVWTQKEKKERPEGGKRERSAKKAMKSTIAVKGPAGKKDKGADKMSEKMREKLKEVDAELKCWIGGMKQTTTWKQLKSHFVDQGFEVDICHITKPGRACVVLKTADDVSSAVASLNGSDCDGQAIEVDVWTMPERKEKKKKKGD